MASFISSRRHRIELPSLCPEFIQLIQLTEGQLGEPNPTPQVKQAAIDLLDEECKCVDSDAGWYGDVPIFDLYNPPRWPSTDTNNIGQVLVALYWRARVQSGILDMFMHLHNMKHLKLSGLKQPLGYTVSDDAHVVRELLGTFEGVSSDNMSWGLIDIYHMGEFLDWFSTMIVREWVGPLDLLFAAIEESGIFGKVDADRYQTFLTNHQNATPNIKYDETCNVATEYKGDKVVCLGYRLPSGLGDITDDKILLKICDIYAHFDRIERTYKQYFGLSDQQLITSEQQAHVLDR